VSDIRYDLIHNDYTIIAPERLVRPDSISSDEDKKVCPFCPGNESMTTEEIFSLKDSNGNWKTRVVPNLYKAVKIEMEWRNEDIGVYEKWPGFGAHEIIIDTPRHLNRMDKWKRREIRDWLYTLKMRLSDLRNDIRLVYFSIFKNHGFQAGATQEHPHTQLIALPIIPKSQQENIYHAYRYFKEHGYSLFDRVIREEIEDSSRLIINSDNFIAFAPFASSFPFEIEILSKNRDLISLSDLGESDIDELSKIIKSIFKSLYKELGEFDFNIIFNTPPMQKNYATEEYYEDIRKFWRLSISILPRLYRLGGFEIGSGMIINPVTPEQTASLLVKYLD